MTFTTLDEKLRRLPIQVAVPAMVRVRIDIHCNVQALEAEWLRFQKHAAGTFFQTSQWCKAWLDTAGQAARVRPLVVLGRNPEGDLLFILPFCIRHRQGCRVLEWMGGQQMTYGYGLYDRRFLRQAGP